MLDFLALALSQNTNPFALAGYIGLGVYATSTWRCLQVRAVVGPDHPDFCAGAGQNRYS